MLKALLDTENALLDADEVRRNDVKRLKFTRVPTLCEEVKDSKASDVLAEAFGVIDAIIRDFEMFDVGVPIGREKLVRFKYQRDMHTMGIRGMVNNILGNKAWMYEPDIKGRYGFKDIHQKAFAVTMSRRMGKSIAVIMLCVALLRQVKNIKILVIANSFRAARSFVQQCASVLKELGHTKLDPDNEKSIGLNFGHGDERTIVALPGNSPDTLRGQGCDFLVVDEAAFLKKIIAQKFVGPLLNVGKTCVMAMSTLGEEGDNYFNRIIELGIFETLNLSLVCDNCIKEGLRETCIHRKDLIPPWHDQNMSALMKLLTDDPETYARENLGYAAKIKNDPRVFPEEYVDAFIRAPRTPFTSPVKYIFLMIHAVPGTGSQPTSRTRDFVAATMAYPQRKLLGMERMCVTTQGDYIGLLASHISRVRKIKGCTTSSVILDVASTVTLQAKSILDHLSPLVPSIVPTWEMDGPKAKKMSLRSFDDENMVFSTLNAFKENKIGISPDFVTLSHVKGAEGMLETLSTQLKAIERRRKPGRTRLEISGRGEREELQDDLGIIFMDLVRQLESYAHLGVVVR